MLVRFRILLGAIAAVVLVVIITGGTGLYAVSIVNKQYELLALQSQNELLFKTIEQVEDDLTIELPKFARNSGLKKALFREKWIDVPEAVFTTYNALSAGGVLDSLIVTSPSAKILYSGGQDSHIGQVSQSKVLKLAISENTVAGGIDLSASGDVVITVANPITRRGSAIGYIVLQKNVSHVFTSLKEKSKIESVLLDPTHIPSFETSIGIWTALKENLEFDAEQGLTILPNNEKILTAIYRPLHFVDGSVAGTWLSLIDTTETQSELAEIRTISSIGFFLTLVLLVLGLYYYMKRTLDPLRVIVEVMQRLIEGERDIAVPQFNKHDEIGAITKTVLLLKDNLLETERLAKEEQDRQTGELQKAERTNDLILQFDTEIKDSLKAVTLEMDSMRNASTHLDRISNKAGEISTSAAKSSDNASANVATVSAAAEQLTASIIEINEQVQRSVSVTNEAAEQTEETEKNIRRLEGAANEISVVVQLITDIAEQTNLLALNATIEAARAGDAGKGFAVVANEVKTLASQTANATVQITKRIGDIQMASGTAAEGVEKISGTVQTVRDVTTSIAGAVEQQGAATQEIARNINEASQGTTEVNSRILEVRDVAAEAKQQAEIVNSAVDVSAMNSDSVNQAIKRFLNDIVNVT